MMTGFLFAFCMCVSLDFNSELFLAPYLCICLSAPRIPIDGLFFFLARARGPELLVDYSESYNVPLSYRQPSGNGQLLSRRYCTHSGWLFSCATRTAHSPKALWRFRASTSNSPSGRSRPHTTRIFVIFIILTLNKIFEYVEMTILSRPRGSTQIPRRFDFFA